uniref:Uncharacterized protein n=1 Tax=Oryza punctata TaxID=4537 RepID=A0A0E0LNC9_ORYPU
MEMRSEEKEEMISFDFVGQPKAPYISCHVIDVQLQGYKQQLRGVQHGARGGVGGRSVAVCSACIIPRRSRSLQAVRRRLPHGHRRQGRRRRRLSLITPDALAKLAARRWSRRRRSTTGVAA